MLYTRTSNMLKHTVLFQSCLVKNAKSSQLRTQARNFSETFLGNTCCHVLCKNGTVHAGREP